MGVDLPILNINVDTATARFRSKPLRRYEHVMDVIMARCPKVVACAVGVYQTHVHRAM